MVQCKRSKRRSTIIAVFFSCASRVPVVSTVGNGIYCCREIRIFILASVLPDAFTHEPIIMIEIISKWYEMRAIHYSFWCKF